MKRRNFFQAAGMGIAGFFAGLFGVKAVEKPKYEVGVDLAKGEDYSKITHLVIPENWECDVTNEGKDGSEISLRGKRLESIHIHEYSDLWSDKNKAKHYNRYLDSLKINDEIRRKLFKDDLKKTQKELCDMMELTIRGK